MCLDRILLSWTGDDDFDAKLLCFGFGFDGLISIAKTTKTHPMKRMLHRPSDVKKSRACLSSL